MLALRALAEISIVLPEGPGVGPEGEGSGTVSQWELEVSP